MQSQLLFSLSSSTHNTMESCAPGLTSWNFFPLLENFNLLFALSCLPVFKPKAIGQGIEIRTKVEPIWRLIFIYWDICVLCVRERERDVTLYISRKSSPFFKNCETHLIRGRKLKRVTQMHISRKCRSEE